MGAPATAGHERHQPGWLEVRVLFVLAGLMLECGVKVADSAELGEDD
jgi:hypothetical protein